MDRSDACAISQLPSGLWITELWQKLWPDDQQEHHHWHAYLEHRSPPEALQERAADEWPDRGACREARDPNADGERPLTRHQFGWAMKCPAKTILKNRQAIGYRNFSMGFKDARQQSKRTLATSVHTNRSMADPLTNEALPEIVEHVGIYADMSVGLRLGLVSLYVVLPRLRRGVALTEKS
jgi:hypothetical protein